MKYKLAHLNLNNPYFLAPMAEVNDIAFRFLCKKAGCGLAYTGMINPLTQNKIHLEDKPAIQLFSTTTEGIKEFIEKYEKQAKLFDFNLGCPSKIAKKLGFGVFLHNRLETIEEILKIMRNSTKKPITIKIRKSDEAKKIIKIANKYCDAISVHPRTAEQGYSGIPDIKFAEEIKKLTPLPIIYSGNVNEKNSKELLKKFDFLMIGREAIGNPGIFAKLNKKDSKIKFKDYLKLAERYKIKYSQIKFQAMNFTKNQQGAKHLRTLLVRAKTLEDIKDIMKGI
jgi:tRNA-dihydrouridine synthase